MELHSTKSFRCQFGLGKAHPAKRSGDGHQWYERHWCLFGVYSDYAGRKGFFLVVLVAVAIAFAFVAAAAAAAAAVMRGKVKV